MDTLVKSLVAVFVNAAHELQARRFEIGDTVLRLWECTGNRAETTRLLKAALPNAKEVLGFAITTPNLTALANMADTFKADGGLIHGPHRLTREDIQALGLKTNEAAQLTDGIKAGNMRIKTVAQAVKRIANDPQGTKGKRGAKAQARIKAMLTNGNDSAPATESLDAKRERLAKLTKRIGELERQRDALAAEIAKATEQPKAKAQRRKSQQREAPRHIHA